MPLARQGSAFHADLLKPRVRDQEVEDCVTDLGAVDAFAASRMCALTSKPVKLDPTHSDKEDSGPHNRFDVLQVFKVL